MDCLLGIDIGTNSSKGVLVDKGGGILASHQINHSVSFLKPRWAEHDTEAIWWTEFRTIIRVLLDKSGIDPKKICSIGVSTIAPCVVPVDKFGKALRPAILYGIDSRAYKEIQFLENEIGKDEIFRHSGGTLSSQSCTPKILWLKRNEPEVYYQTRYFFTGTGYINYRLTGVASLDSYTSVGYPLLVNMEKRTWDDQYASFFTSLDKLPKITWTSDVIGGLTESVAAELGLVSGTPVITGTSDAGSEAISTGLREFGDMMMMYGSSNFFILKTDSLLRTREFWPGNFLEEGTFAVAGGLANCGSISKWFKTQIGVPSEYLDPSSGNAYDQLSAAAANSEPGAGGLIALPYFTGERTPLHDSDAKGALLGLTLKHSKGDIYRAFLESIGYGIRHNLESLGKIGIIPKRFLAIGGGIKDRFWLQLISDICGIEQHIPNKHIGASYGDAFLAGVGVGMFSSSTEINRWVQTETVVRPDTASVDIYTSTYRLFREFYESTKNIMRKLS